MAILPLVALGFRWIILLVLKCTARTTENAAVVTSVHTASRVFEGTNLSSHSFTEHYNCSRGSLAAKKYGYINVDTFFFDSTNFGDALGPIIVQRVLDLGCTCNVCLNVTNTRHKQRGNLLMTVGSIFHFCKSGDVLWGTGSMLPHFWPEAIKNPNISILAVRGRLFSDLLQERGFQNVTSVPNILGDPAMLFGHIFPEFRHHRNNLIKKNGLLKPLLVLHKNTNVTILKRDPTFTLFDVQSAIDRWHRVCERISAARFVVSTSLHGIIIAEAFGVPAFWITMGYSDPAYEIFGEKDSSFKFRDYYSATSRPATFSAALKPFSSLHDAYMAAVAQEDAAARSTGAAVDLDYVSFRFAPLIDALFAGISKLIERNIAKVSPSCNCLVIYWRRHDFAIIDMPVIMYIWCHLDRHTE